jgi:hypothetical protein
MSTKRVMGTGRPMLFSMNRYVPSEQCGWQEVWTVGSPRTALMFFETGVQKLSGYQSSLLVIPVCCSMSLTRSGSV